MKPNEFIDLVNKNKSHIIPISLIFVLCLVAHYDYLSINYIRIGETLESVENFFFVRESIMDFHQFPLWNNAVQGGIPFFAHPINPVISLSTFLSTILPTLEGVFNICQLLNIFLAGLFMYILMVYFKLPSKFAFLSAVSYMLSVYMNWMAVSFTRINVASFFPLLFLFIWIALKEEEWLKYSILSGIILAIEFFNSIEIFLYNAVLFLVLFTMHLFGKNLIKRILKISFISIVIIITFFGLTAIKLLPMLEYNKKGSTDKIENWDFQESIGGKIKVSSFSDFINTFIIAKRDEYAHESASKIGLPLLILALISFLLWKKRFILNNIVLLITSLLIIMGTNFYYIFWKFIPGVSKMHNVYRGSFIFVFAAAFLGGFGAYSLFLRFKDKHKLSQKTIDLFYTVVVLIILGDLLFNTAITYDRSDKNNPPNSNFQLQLENNYLLQNLSNDNDIFRINNIDTKSHGGYAPKSITLLDLQMVYGGYGLWIPEFYTYLGITHSFPAKFLGMLNVKYIYSNHLLNIFDLKFLKEFPNCSICREDPNTDFGINGPYLYYNELYLPRAYFVNYSILVIGDKNTVDQTTYVLMINNNFDPSNTAIVMEYGKVNDRNINFLKKFNVIVLTQNSIDQNSGFLLKQYVDSGGKLLPNVVDGKNSVSQNDVDDLLSSLKGDYKKVRKADISYYSPNKITINLKGERGWMVLAEKFFMFEGWEPKINSIEKPIYRADGMNSAVYVEGESDEMVFKYWPKSFQTGLIISSATLVLIVLFFIWDYYRRRKSNEKIIIEK